MHTTSEITLAIKKGYVVEKIFEAWHYAVKGDLFSKYIDTFMNLKVSNSGWPSTCFDEPSKLAYLELLRRQNNVTVTTDQIQDNPSLKLLSKLMLNTLWKRLAIKDNKPKFEYVQTTERFNRLFYSN